MLRKLLSNTILCRVSPEEFSFHRFDEVVSLGTYVIIDDTKKDLPLILRVGEDISPDDYPGERSLKRVSLFAPSPDDWNVNKLEYLSVLLMYAFKKLYLRQIVVVHPKWIFENTASLNGILCGYAECILTVAAERVGARDCEFVS